MHDDEHDIQSSDTQPDSTRSAGAAVESDDPTADVPRSEATTAEMQRSATEDSPAVDADTDLDAVQTLPGEGGPDDGGDIEVDPADLNLSGDSIPGHPKPGPPKPRG